jgi:hypothetical protein
MLVRRSPKGVEAVLHTSLRGSLCAVTVATRSRLGEQKPEDELTLPFVLTDGLHTVNAGLPTMVGMNAALLSGACRTDSAVLLRHRDATETVGIAVLESLRALALAEAGKTGEVTLLVIGHRVGRVRIHQLRRVIDVRQTGEMTEFMEHDGTH